MEPRILFLDIETKLVETYNFGIRDQHITYKQIKDLDASGRTVHCVGLKWLGQRKVTVCFRASDRHHTLFVTNQCNSRCLMCSQPPTPQEDEWLFDEAMEIVALVEEAPTVIGISGGEPTLHPQRLRALLDVIHSRWPSTQVEVLTNARRLGDEGCAGLLLDGLAVGRTTWLVPLYGASDEVHDFVVQSPGARRQLP